MFQINEKEYQWQGAGIKLHLKHSILLIAVHCGEITASGQLVMRCNNERRQRLSDYVDTDMITDKLVLSTFSSSL